jgi:hypothetical protein
MASVSGTRVSYTSSMKPNPGSNGPCGFVSVVRYPHERCLQYTRSRPQGRRRADRKRNRLAISSWWASSIGPLRGTSTVPLVSQGECRPAPPVPWSQSQHVNEASFENPGRCQAWLAVLAHPSYDRGSGTVMNCYPCHLEAHLLAAGRLFDRERKREAGRRIRSALDIQQADCPEVWKRWSR